MLGFSLSASDPAPSPGLRYLVITSFSKRQYCKLCNSRDAFKTKIQVSGSEPGPAPDTTAFIQRLEEEKRRQEKGEVGLGIRNTIVILFGAGLRRTHVMYEFEF